MESSLLTTLVWATLVVAATAVLLWVLNRRHQHSLFRRYGIPGPKPDFFSGNWMQLKKNRLEVMESWIKTYGKVFGYYVGEVPYMVVTDLNIIKQCLVKEANIAFDRPDLVVNVEPFTSCLIGLGGEEWKRIRATLNPIFTSAKMKMVTQIIQNCADEMLEVLADLVQKGEIVDMATVTRGFSMDVITKSALAWQVDCQKNPTDPLLMGVQKVFEDVDNAVIVNAIRFPILRKILEWLYPYASYYKIINKITENVLNVVKLRRSGQSPRTTDMLQLMLDAQTSGEESSIGSGSNATVFEDRHLLSNCFLFLIAGFDTTASSLAFIMHVLAKYPEEQERVFNEISKAFPDGAELTYDGVQHLKRLDMVVCETLRLYPPVVLFVSRHCTRDTTVSGQFFPAGVNVLLPTWHVHHDPDFWPEPLKFDPERFSEGEKVQSAYFPFGLGPRVCIGKRFALLEVKLATCNIIRRYRVSKCEQTQDPLRFVVPSVVLNPENGIRVRLQKR
ncbi:unnamed protein product [Ixodes persulcatus]